MTFLVERPVGREGVGVVELKRRAVWRVLLLELTRRVFGMTAGVAELVDLDTARTSVGSALIFTSVLDVLEVSGSLGAVEGADGLSAFLIER